MRIEEAIKLNAEAIRQILINAEYVQESNESRYTKEQTKINAYDEIVKLIKGA